MDYNRQGPTRRNPAPSSNDNFFTMDFQSADPPMPSYGDGRRSTTATPGPPMGGPAQPPPSSFGGPSQNPYGGFNAPMDQSFGGPSFGGPQPPPQQQFNTYMPGGPPGPQGPQPQNPYASAFAPQQQFLMAAGEQLFTNPMTKAAIDAYSQSLVDRSKTWIGGVKCYFAVDTSYVMKKLMLIFLPFLHKDWCIRYSSDSVTPRDEPNLPDLYIPSMAFITYCLLSGYILGLQNRFAPEQLGIYASSALAWLLLEVFIIVVAKYVLNMSSLLGFFHLIAFGGYKFVSIVAILMFTLVFGQTGFMGAFGYTACMLMYFLLKSLNANLQTTNSANYSGHDAPRTGQYLVIVVCLFQPIVMWFLTNSLKQAPQVPVVATP